MVLNCEYDIAIAMAILQTIATVPSMGLLSLIRLLNQFEATDPRDKLFALLGIDSVVDVTVRPDYGKSPEKVYIDFACAFIREKTKLTILGGTGIGYPKPEPIMDLPS